MDAFSTMFERFLMGERKYKIVKVKSKDFFKNASNSFYFYLFYPALIREFSTAVNFFVIDEFTHLVSIESTLI